MFSGVTPVFSPFSFSAHISYIQAFISPVERWKKTKPKSSKKMKEKAKYQTIIID
ncbi:hypothetical protein JCM19300_2229 [Algibacter lectus]|uniref:Uncharacterized protein n=1 Tax=Algibacter lectus TaxID=221126 RepID=A0A090VJV0_9FLAO|nr:hypothetical protein JCM19300_2229 [Algibacter lectus]